MSSIEATKQFIRSMEALEKEKQEAIQQVAQQAFASRVVDDPKPDQDDQTTQTEVDTGDQHTQTNLSMRHFSSGDLKWVNQDGSRTQLIMEMDEKIARDDQEIAGWFEKLAAIKEQSAEQEKRGTLQALKTRELLRKGEDGCLRQPYDGWIDPKKLKKDAKKRKTDTFLVRGDDTSPEMADDEVTWQCKAKDGTILGTFTQSFGDEDETWNLGYVPIGIKREIQSKLGLATSAFIKDEPVMSKDHKWSFDRLPPTYGLKQDDLEAASQATSVKQDNKEAKNQATSVEQKGEAMPASTSVEQSQATSVEHKGKAMSASVEQSQGSSVEKKSEATSGSVEQSQATSGKEKGEATLSAICQQLSVIEKQEQADKEKQEQSVMEKQEKLFSRKRKEAEQSSDWLEAPKPSEWMWPRGAKIWPSTP